ALIPARRRKSLVKALAGFAWRLIKVFDRSAAFFHAKFFFSSRRRHTRWPRDWSSDVCSSDLLALAGGIRSCFWIVPWLNLDGFGQIIPHTCKFVNYDPRDFQLAKRP